MSELNSELNSGFMGSALQANATALTRGVDISHWQSRCDFQQMIANGNKFVAMKATQGTSFVDSRLHENATNSTGLYRMPYHFWRNADPGAQADHFFNTVSKYSWELSPVLDFETLNANPNHVKLFLEVIANLFNRKPIVYSSPYFWNSLGDTSSWASKYDLWVAHWGATTPTLPRAWNTWVFWQYSSTGNGAENGVSSQFVDLNYFNGTEQDLNDYAKGSGGQIPPSPPPIKRVKITANALNLRDAPMGNKLGYTVKDRVWDIVEEAKDEQGRLWYKGEAWFASWWTKEV